MPLLYLAGIIVTIIKTQSGSHARNAIIDLETPTDAIIVAGGDGTLSDVVTGLMRKYENNLQSVKQCPIGILPLGNTNTIASKFFQEYTDLSDIHYMIDATMAIIKNNFKTIDTLEIKVLEVCILIVSYLFNLLFRLNYSNIKLYFNSRMIQMNL